jgi:hypothetical protein
MTLDNTTSLIMWHDFAQPNFLIQNYSYNTTATHDNMAFENPILSYYRIIKWKNQYHHHHISFKIHSFSIEDNIENFNLVENLKITHRLWHLSNYRQKVQKSSTKSSKFWLLLYNPWLTFGFFIQKILEFLYLL